MATTSSIGSRGQKSVRFGAGVLPRVQTASASFTGSFDASSSYQQSSAALSSALFSQLGDRGSSGDDSFWNAFRAYLCHVFARARVLGAKRQRSAFRELVLGLVFFAQAVVIFLNPFDGWSEWSSRLLSILYIPVSWIPLMYGSETSIQVSSILSLVIGAGLGVAFVLSYLDYQEKFSSFFEKTNLGRVSLWIVRQTSLFVWMLFSAPLIEGSLGPIRCSRFFSGSLVGIGEVEFSGSCESSGSYILGAFGLLNTTWILFYSFFASIMTVEHRTNQSSWFSGVRAGSWFAIFLSLRIACQVLNAIGFRHIPVVFHLVIIIVLLLGLGKTIRCLPFAMHKTNQFVSCVFGSCIGGVIASMIAISSTHPGIALGCFAGISILGTVLILLLILTRIRSLQNKYEKSILSVDHEAVDPLQVMDMFEDEYTVLILTRPGFLYSYENESQQLQNSEDSRVDIHSYDSFHSGTQVKSSFSREKFLLWVSEIFSLAEKSFPTSPSVRVLHALALHTTTSDTRRVFSKLRELRENIDALPLTEYFVAYRLNQDINESSESDDERRRLQSVRKLVSRCRILHQKLWKNCMQDTVDIESLPVIIETIEEVEDRCRTAFKGLIRDFPSSSRVLRLFAQFSRDIDNNESAADQLLLVADEVEEQASAKLTIALSRVQKQSKWEELRAIFNETDRHEESHEDGFEKENGHHFEDILDEHSLKPDLPGRVQIDPQGRDSNARNESTKPAESVFSISKSTRSKSMKHTSRRSKSIRGRKSDGAGASALSSNESFSSSQSFDGMSSSSVRLNAKKQHGSLVISVVVFFCVLLALFIVAMILWRNTLSENEMFTSSMHRITRSRYIASDIGTRTTSLYQAYFVGDSALVTEARNRLKLSADLLQQEFTLFIKESSVVETFLSQTCAVELYSPRSGQAPSRISSTSNIRSEVFRLIDNAQWIASRPLSLGRELYESKQYWEILRNIPGCPLTGLSRVAEELYQISGQTVDSRFFFLFWLLAGLAVLAILDFVFFVVVFSSHEKQHMLALRLFLTLPKSAVRQLFSKFSVHRAASFAMMSDIEQEEARNEIEDIDGDQTMKSDSKMKRLPRITALVTCFVAISLAVWSSQSLSLRGDSSVIFTGFEYGSSRISAFSTAYMFLYDKIYSSYPSRLKIASSLSSSEWTLPGLLLRGVYSKEETLRGLTKFSDQFQSSSTSLQFGSNVKKTNATRSMRIVSVENSPQCSPEALLASAGSTSNSAQFPVRSSSLADDISNAANCFSPNVLSFRAMSEIQRLVTLNNQSALDESIPLQVSNSSSLFLGSSYQNAVQSLERSFRMMLESQQEKIDSLESFVIILFAVGVVLIVLTLTLFTLPAIRDFRGKTEMIRRILGHLPIDIISNHPALGKFVLGGSSVTQGDLDLALKESEERMASILIGATEGLLVSNDKAIVEMTNKVFAQMVKLPQDEIIGKSLNEFIPPEIRPFHNEWVAKKASSKSKDRMIGRVIISNLYAADGTTLPVKVSISEAKFNKITFFAAFIADISVERQEKQEIEDLQDRFRFLLNMNRDTIFLIDDQGTIKSSNSRILSMLDYTEEEIVNMNICDVIMSNEGSRLTPEELAAIFSNGEDMLATAVTKNGRPVEGMVRIADITSISKLSSASALTLQNLLEGPREVMRDYVVFFADRSIERNILGSSRDALSEVQGMIDVYDHGLLLCESNGIIVYSNPTALQIFGYEKVDLNGKNISIVINHPQHRKNHDQYLENYLRTGRSDVIGQRGGRFMEAVRKNREVIQIHLVVLESRSRGSRYFIAHIEPADRFLQRSNDAKESLLRERSVMGSIFPSVSLDMIFPSMNADGSAKGQGDSGSASTSSDGNLGSSVLKFADVAVFACDLVNFTRVSSQTTPQEMIELMSSLFDAFDERADRLGVSRLKIMGDAYIAAIGIHPSNAISSQSGRVDDSSTHDDQLASERRMENASTCVNFALSVIEHLQSLPQNSNVEDPLVAFRMGIHIGYCTVCVLGEDMKTFEIFGDAYKTAVSLEETGVRNRLHVSKDIMESLQSQDDDLVFTDAVTVTERVMLNKQRGESFFVDRRR